MLAVANTALDLLVLELVLHGLSVGVLALLLLVLAPVHARAEDDVLADRGGVGCGTDRVARAVAKLAPGLALGDAGVDLFRVRGVADAAGRLDLLVLLVEAVRDDGLGAIPVADGLRRGKVGGGDVIDVFVVGPAGRKEREYTVNYRVPTLEGKRQRVGGVRERADNSLCLAGGGHDCGVLGLGT